MDENKNFGYGTENAQEQQTYGQNAQTAGQEQQTYGQNAQGYGQGTQSYGQNAQTAGQGTQSYGQNAQTAGQDAQTYGQSYGQSSQSYGQSYGQSSQSYGTVYGQPGYSVGGTPMGNDGQPLKNNYAMKMVFGILEILCCCGCNIITMILGIIALVFNGKANRAYQQGNAQEYKSNAKTSTILLWVGFGIAVAYLIFGILEWTVFGGKDDFMEGFYRGYYGSDYEDTDTDEHDDYDDDDHNDDVRDDDDAIARVPEDKESNATAPLPDVTPGEGFTDPTIIIDGTTVTFPLTYSDFEALGFYIEDEDKQMYVNQDEFYDVDVYMSDGTELGTVFIGNETEHALPLEESMVFGFELESEDWDGVYTVEFPNGLQLGSSAEDFKTAYGEPDYEYESDTSDYQSYQWYNHHDSYYDADVNSISVTFWEGELDEIDIEYIGWD